MTEPSDYATQRALERQAERAAIPEPEWEPTDEQIEQYAQAHDSSPEFATPTLTAWAVRRLKAMHREGLL